MPQAEGEGGGQQAALQRKLLDSSPDTLQQQESLSISGQSARHLVMQRLMRRRASRTVLLCNMVSAEEVDEALHHEIQVRTYHIPSLIYSIAIVLHSSEFIRQTQSVTAS